MRDGITGLDHVLIGVRDLEAARARWQGLGFTLTPRGRHIGWGTANYCVMLEQGYVELLGIVDPSRFVNRLDEFLKKREGLMGLAFATDAAALTARQLAGLSPDGPKDLKRVLELPEGDAVLSFSLVFLPPEATPGVSAFVCQHLTPGLLRRPQWLRHENGARAIEGVTAVHGAPGSLALAYARLFGEDGVSIDEGTLAVDTGGGWLRLVAPERAAKLYPHWAPAAEPPYLASMTLTVGDPARAAAWFAGRGVPTQGTTGGFALPPEAANGTILEFIR